ncbi:unnamed protein product [Pleuronectes platessa]|uniref:Uncharacterized protein n=1 Tax=Pleuronectes platessa TaxID=8262 RepID=A0A9N7TYB4_PLEPL|nr:unnamed protein product [Pleuronectes platessa]
MTQGDQWQHFYQPTTSDFPERRSLSVEEERQILFLLAQRNSRCHRPNQRGRGHESFTCFPESADRAQTLRIHSGPINNGWWAADGPRAVVWTPLVLKVDNINWRSRATAVATSSWIAIYGSWSVDTMVDPVWWILCCAG